jgi:hypothetical protein
MEYQVPQFIEVEDKVVGPLTLKQFIYIAGTMGLCIVFFFKLPLIPGVLLSIPTIALGGALSFYKINGKPFIAVLEAGFNYYVGAKFFLWQHKEEKPGTAATAAARKAAAAAEVAVAQAAIPKLTRGRLSELASSLDVPRGDEKKTPEVLHGSFVLTPSDHGN